MLRKVLKYDLRYIWRIWWIIAVSVVGFSLLGSLALRFCINGLVQSSDESGALLALILLFVVLGSFVAIIGSTIGTVVLVFMRFYKSFFSDEGYLTFTLPVSRRTHLLAKTLNAVIWIIAQTALMTGCIAVFMAIAFPDDSGAFINLGTFDVLGDLFGVIWQGLGGWSIAYILAAILVALAGSLFSIALLQLSITIGATIAKKRKVLVGIGIYYGVSMGSSFLMQAVGTSSLFSIIANAGTIFGNITSAGRTHGLILSVLVLATALIATAAIVLWCITLDILERRLNLA